MNIELADQIAMNWRPPKDAPQVEMITVDVEKADKLFVGWEGYMPPFSEDTQRGEDLLAKFEAFAASHVAEEIDCPVVFVTPINLMFYNGRHRYSVLRDSGVKKMKLAAVHPSKRIAEKLGILAA